jgi:hypothetical protein
MADMLDDAGDDVRPVRLVPALVTLRDRYGDPFWILGIELWTTMLVVRYAGIETEMQMQNRPAEWFRLEDDLGGTYQPGGGSMSGGSVGSSLEHRRRFSGQLEFTPGLNAGAKTLTIALGDRIRSGPIDIAVG